ncbi:MAG: helix-turn-helix domain-containing protein, partial [Candidatus Gracilibacteria bacterium]
DKETAVYLIMHKIGPAAASTLARLTNIKRTSIYDILNNLLERNLIISLKHGKNTYYSIDDVNKIFYQAKEKMFVAEKLVTNIKKSPHEWQGLQVNYYKGVEGYREMYEDILRAKPLELCGWMHLDKFYEGIDMVREAEWTKERIKSGIKVRLLLQDTELTRSFSELDKVSNREVRFIKPEFQFSTTCFIYEDHIVFFSSGEEMTCVRLHHPEFYRMQKAIFEMNWELYANTSK